MPWNVADSDACKTRVKNIFLKNSRQICIYLECELNVHPWHAIDANARIGGPRGAGSAICVSRSGFCKMTDRSGFCKTLGRGGPGFAIFPRINSDTRGALLGGGSMSGTRTVRSGGPAAAPRFQMTGST